jgi:hypothetical protein
MNENPYAGVEPDAGQASVSSMPPVLASCRARHIITSDQVECLSRQSKGCEFAMRVGKAWICLHPERHTIVARG